MMIFLSDFMHKIWILKEQIPKKNYEDRLGRLLNEYETI